MIVLLIVTVFFIALYSDQSMATNIKRTAIITSFKDDVLVYKSGAERPIQAYQGMYLAEGDRIETGKDSMVKISMDFNKDIELSNNSILNISQLAFLEDGEAERTQLHLVAGYISFDVKKKLNLSSQFIIIANGNRYSIKGTEGGIGFTGRRIFAFLNEGRMLLQARSGGRVNISANRFVIQEKTGLEVSSIKSRKDLQDLINKMIEQNQQILANTRNTINISNQPQYIKQSTGSKQQSDSLGDSGYKIETIIPPTVLPNPNDTYIDSVEIILSNEDYGGIVYYTLDGSDPKSSDTAIRYSCPITINESKIIKTYCEFYNEGTHVHGISDVVELNYKVVKSGNATANVINPADGEVLSSLSQIKGTCIDDYQKSVQSVELVIKNEDDKYLQNDGTWSKDIFWISTDNAGNSFDAWKLDLRNEQWNSINTNTGTYVIDVKINDGADNIINNLSEFIIKEKVALPNAIPAAGEYNVSQYVYLTSPTEGATIYYTTDGSEPKTSVTRNKYDSPIEVSESVNMKVYAGKEGMIDGDTVIFAYIINGGNKNVDVTLPENEASLADMVDQITGSVNFYDQSSINSVQVAVKHIQDATHTIYLQTEGSFSNTVNWFDAVDTGIDYNTWKVELSNEQKAAIDALPGQYMISIKVNDGQDILYEDKTSFTIN